VNVILNDGRTFEGKVQGVDEVTDLAVVKINAGGDLGGSPGKLRVCKWRLGDRRWQPWDLIHRHLRNYQHPQTPQQPSWHS